MHASQTASLPLFLPTEHCPACLPARPRFFHLQFQKPKKKKERKLKKKAALTEDELAALAADAEARGGWAGVDVGGTGRPCYCTCGVLCLPACRW